MDSVLQNKLLSLFDYQRFAQDKSLSDIINDTERRYANVTIFSRRAALGDDLAELVNAAGDIATLENPPREDEKTT